MKNNTDTSAQMAVRGFFGTMRRRPARPQAAQAPASKKSTAPQRRNAAR